MVRVPRSCPIVCLFIMRLFWGAKLFPQLHLRWFLRAICSMRPRGPLHRAFRQVAEPVYPAAHEIDWPHSLEVCARFFPGPTQICMRRFVGPNESTFLYDPPDALMGHHHLPTCGEMALGPTSIISLTDSAPVSQAKETHANPISCIKCIIIRRSGSRIERRRVDDER